jgi:hypothetical protein
MRILLCTLVAVAGCHHAKEAEVVSAYEPRATIGQTFTADATRLLPAGSTSTPAAVDALVEIAQSHLAAVGQLRPLARAADHVDVVADLPAPGWALRVRIVPKAELLCLVTIEPLALQPTEHAVDAAPWSVQDAFDEVRRFLPSLQPSKQPPMFAARFAELRAQAAAAAAEGKDPALTPSEYVRVPRPLSSDSENRPYVVPPEPDPSQEGVERKQ